MKLYSKPQTALNKKAGFTAGFLTALMITGMLCPAAAFAANASDLAAGYVSSNYTTDNIQEGSSFTVILNGEDVTDSFSNTVKVTTDGRTLIPLRDLGNILGADVDWDSASKVAILTKGSATVEVPIGSTMLIIDGQAQQIDEEGTQAVIVGEGYTYLPLRAISEALGAEVSYEAGTKTIYLTTGSSETAASEEALSAITGDPNLAAIGIYSAIDLGFSAANLPAEGEDYYDSVVGYVNAGRSVGLTDEQINEGLSQIYPCKSNGDGSGYVTTEQYNHYKTIFENITATYHPTYAGDYKYQIVGTWMWSGSGWDSCGMEVAGLTGLSIKL